MGFWRKEVIEFALERETRQQVREQLEWIGREPSNPKPYYHLAQFLRTEGKQERALGLLLEAVGLDQGFAPAHVALTEIYAVRGDYASAWRHAHLAARYGDSNARELLARYGIKEDADS
jgi:hypothetical protein